MALSIPELQSTRAVLVNWLTALQNMPPGMLIATSDSFGSDLEMSPIDRLKATIGPFPVAVTVVATPGSKNAPAVLQKYMVFARTTVEGFARAQGVARKIDSNLPNAVTKKSDEAIPIVKAMIAAIDRMIATIGTTVDVSFPKPEPTPSPFYKKWWFWAAVGVVVVGGGYYYTKKKGTGRTLPEPATA